MDDERLPRLLADVLGRSFPRPTPRRVRLGLLPRKADAVIGMRRTGKTWVLFAAARGLMDQGVQPWQILYLDLEEDRCQGMTAEDLSRLFDLWTARHPVLLDRERWLLLDEVQVVPGWEQFVRRILGTDGCRVLLSGSSARLLSREIATNLRGRCLTTEVRPFSFAEVLDHFGVDIAEPWPLPEAKRAVVRHRFDRYLQAGGFPEILGVDDEIRRRVVDGYVDVVMLRDVVERHGVANVTALRRLVRQAQANPATLLSVHRIHQDLRSQGVAVGKDLLHDLLGHLEDAFFLHAIPIWTMSERVRQSNPRKILLADTALGSAPLGRDTGHLLENLVGIELLRRGNETAWLRTRTGQEVDFVATDPSGRCALVQVCTSLADPAVRKREVGALAAGMEEIPGAEGVIVTLDSEGRVDAAGRTVRVVPAWEWLLR